MKDSQANPQPIQVKLLGPEAKAPHAIVDVAFLCDCTGSMGIFIDKAKDTVRKIVADIRAEYSDASIFFAFVAYRDHEDGNALLQLTDLTGDVESVLKFIDKLSAFGGGDEAEAVADALDAASKLSWRSDSVRQAVLILDAPPHGKEFAAASDSFPAGCPCGKDYKELLKRMHERDIKLLVLNFTPSVANMISIFVQHHPGVESVNIPNQQQPQPAALSPRFAGWGPTIFGSHAGGFAPGAPVFGGGSSSAGSGSIFGAAAPMGSTVGTTQQVQAAALMSQSISEAVCRNVGQKLGPATKR